MTLEHSRQQFTGSNPTAAVVAAALAQGSTEYVNGFKVGSLLQRAALSMPALPCVSLPM